MWEVLVNDLWEVIDAFSNGQLTLAAFFISITDILGKYMDMDTLDDLIKLLGAENTDELVELSLKVGNTELGSILSLISRGYENISAVVDGDIRWDQALRYYGYELILDLGKDMAMVSTGVYGFAAFAVIDLICICKYDKDAVAKLAEEFDNNTYEAWYQSW